MKSFCRKRIPESSCARKESINKDILITRRKDDRKIMQPIRMTKGPAIRIWM